MNSLEAIRAEIAELKDERAGLAARVEQLPKEIEQLQARVEVLWAERCDIDSRLADVVVHVSALERAEAVLVEHSAPAAVEPDPVLLDAPDAPPERQLSLAPADGAPSDGARGRGPGRRHLLNPLHVYPHNVSAHPGGKPGRTAARLASDGEPYAVELARLLASPTWAERRDLVVMLIEDRGGEASGIELAADMADTLDCKLSTAQTISGRCLVALVHLGRVAYSGRKAEDARGALSSPIWKLEEPTS